MASKHWGQIVPETSETEFNIDITADIERSMNKYFLNEFEEDENPAAKTEKIVVPILNPLMVYAVSLHQHSNNIVELIKSNDFTKKSEKINFKIPEHVSTNLNFSSQDFKTYSAGNNDDDDNVQVPDINKAIIRKILMKAIATICAHFGYETSQQSALDVLVDVLQEFYKKITHNFKLTMEDKEMRQMSGFPHAIERVLTEMGMGGVKGLNDYYQSQVIKYINVLENRCKELNEEYQSLSIPKCPSPVDKINKVVRVKVEEEDVVEMENPEVHFSTIDGDVNFSILETGYQLLNSLEAEANLQSLGEPVEDIVVSESPSIASGEDVAHLSPFSKKKRFK